MEYGPHNTLKNRWKRWSDKRVFEQIMTGLTSVPSEERTVMIQAIYLKAHRSASSLGAGKGEHGRRIGQTKGGMITKLYSICDGRRRPINPFVTYGKVSDCIGARALLESVPNVEGLLGDRGLDADWFREALEGQWIAPA